MSKPRIDRVELKDGSWCWRCQDENCYGLGLDRATAYNRWQAVVAELQAKLADAAFTAALRAGALRNEALCFPTLYGTA